MNGSPCGGSLRGSPGGGGMRVPVSTGCHTPMSERQQLALIKQLEKSGSSSTTSSHSGELLLLFDVLFWSKDADLIDKLFFCVKGIKDFLFTSNYVAHYFLFTIFFLLSIDISKGKSFMTDVYI